MKTDIQIFNNKKFGEVRVAKSENGEPLFCLADVCKALGIINQRNVKVRLNPKGVHSIDTLTKGGLQSMIYINEGNLYKTTFQSRKAEAENFQDWLCYEVVPSIRKHGGYLTPQKIAEALLDPDTIIQLATNLKEEKQKRLQAEQTIKKQAPKVLFATAVEGSQSSCLIGELAKILRQNGVYMGQNRLFQWLRENKYLGSLGERRNIPMQKYIEQGLFSLKKGVRSGSGGEIHTTLTTKVTGKGQLYFINKFLTSSTEKL